MESDSERLEAAQASYWRWNVVMVVGFMTVGFSVSFVLPFFARSLSAVRFFGWNLAYYMAAQGAILVYLLLVLAYALAMRKLDRRLEGEAGPSS